MDSISRGYLYWNFELSTPSPQFLFFFFDYPLKNIPVPEVTPISALYHIYKKLSGVNDIMEFFAHVNISAKSKP